MTDTVKKKRKKEEKENLSESMEALTLRNPQLQENKERENSHVPIKFTLDNNNVYVTEKIVGTGSFGVVYKARNLHTMNIVAIKKVLQDRRYKNRELQIMRLLKHQNIVQLENSFVTEEGDKVYLNLVLEFMPENIHRVIRHYAKRQKLIPLILCKLYMYQISRSLAYIHSLGICHRDVKPQNVLLNTKTGVVKLCDFGSAKILVKEEPNISYICSRHYRAPELIFSATDYTTAIDIWSMGCVFAEFLIGQAIFPGENSLDQLVEIIKVLGTPSRDQIQAMNRNYNSFRFPDLPSQPWSRIIGSHCPPDAIDLLSKLLTYSPLERLSALDACAHPFFDELRNSPDGLLPNGSAYPPGLFDFSPQELASVPLEVRQKLVTTKRNSNPDSMKMEKC